MHAVLLLSRLSQRWPIRQVCFKSVFFVLFYFTRVTFLNLKSQNQNMDLMMKKIILYFLILLKLLISSIHT